MALENERIEREEKEKEDTLVIPQGDRGRGGKRDGKRRKGSLLRVGDGSTGNSSLEGSPAPSSVEKGRNRQSSVSQEISPRSPPTPTIAQTPTPTGRNKGKSKASASKVTIPTPEIRLKRPVEEEVIAIEPGAIAQETVPDVSTTQQEDAWTVPLPSSPFAGPSRLTLPPRSTSSISTDGRSDVDSSDARDELNGEEETRIGEKERRSSQGFSIFPEDGYLPPSALSKGQKKKRGKGKAGASSIPIPHIETFTNHQQPNGHTPSPSRARSTSTSQPLSHIPESSSASTFTSPPPTPRRAHSRKTSLGGRPFGMDLEDLLLERERTIDALRAEIGEAKAEEAKAREEVERCRKTEELGGVELERVRRACGKVEHELRRRENDVSFLCRGYLKDRADCIASTTIDSYYPTSSSSICPPSCNRTVHDFSRNSTTSTTFTPSKPFIKLQYEWQFT